MAGFGCPPRLNDKHSLFLRGFAGSGDATAFAGSVYHDYFQFVPSRQSNYAAIWNGVLTPRLVNQLLIGINYFNQTFDDFNHGFNMASLGFNTGVTNPTNYGALNIEISGFGNGGVGETPRLGRQDTTGHLTDNLSYNLGSHSLKFGGEIRKSRLDVFYERDARGGFFFDGALGPWNGLPASPERALADFLGGYVDGDHANKATGDPQRVYDVNSFEWWAQDNWQVNSRLNVNYGVRYTYNGRMHEVGSKGISIFLPSLANAQYPGFGFVGKEIKALYPADYNNFAPRLGFAFTPERGGKTVIRAGYGVYYDLINGNLFIDNRAGGTAGRGLSRNPAGPTPIFAVGAPSEVIQDGVFIFGGATGTPPFGAYTISQGMRSPHVQQFNVNVQRQLSRNMILQVGYVGNQARKLPVTRNINQPIPGLPGTAQERRPFNAEFPNLKGITQLETAGNSHYNGLQMSLRTTSWHGLMGQASYTFSNAKDVMSSPRNNQFTNNYDRNFDYGNADFDVRHTFSGYLVYDLPQFGSSLPRLTKGWQLNALIAADSGFPFSVGDSSADFSHTGNYNSRAAQVSDPFSGVVQPATVGGRYINGYRWFNAAAFTDPPDGSFGTTKRNQYYGPGFGTLDFSIFKNTPITERISTQFRVEIFNLFNRLNLGGPGGDVAAGAGNGLIYGSRHGGDAPGIGYGEPRNVQLALKIIW